LHSGLVTVIGRITPGARKKSHHAPVNPGDYVQIPPAG